MPLNRAEILYVIREICRHRGITATVTNAGKGAATAAICAFVGGVLGGPRGLAIGGAVGSIVAATYGSDYKSAISVINEDMTEAQRNRLVNSVRRLVNSIDATDLVMLTTVIIGSNFETLILKELASVFRTEMGMTLNM